MIRRGFFAAMIVGTLVVLGGTGWWLAYRTAVAQTQERAETRLTQAIDLLLAQLDKYQPMPAVLASRPDIVGLLQAPDTTALDLGNRLLQRIADTTGALDIYVMDIDGTVVASSNWDLDRSFIGQNFAFRPYFQRAIRGGLGYYHAVGVSSGQRGFFFAHPVRDSTGETIGAIAVKIDLEAMETIWRVDEELIFFSDANGIVFLANRDPLLFLALDTGQQTAADQRPEAQYFGADLSPFPARQVKNVFGATVWRDTALSDVPAVSLSLVRPVERIRMQGHILVDLRDAGRQAWVWAALFVVAGAVLWLAALIFWQRRAALARQLATEAQANADLERRVEERTLRLSAEVTERENAETALRLSQAELVQAGKLTALGEMSAGISHELNQPLAAIQSYSENAGVLLGRNELDAVGENLNQIAKLAERMGRIIRNLRAFARKEGEPASAVNVVDIVNEALAIAAPRLAAQQVTLVWDAGQPSISANGGLVRLQQVVVNLISNAVDAMAQQPGDRSIQITLRQTRDRVLLDVRDSGPGLTDADRIFDPFYTTKVVGEGLGLGLSISYGIVQSFGGDIRGTNHDDGGAIFTVDMMRADLQQAAE